MIRRRPAHASATSKDLSSSVRAGGGAYRKERGIFERFGLGAFDKALGNVGSYLCGEFQDFVPFTSICCCGVLALLVFFWWITTFVEGTASYYVESTTIFGTGFKAAGGRGARSGVEHDMYNDANVVPAPVAIGNGMIVVGSTFASTDPSVSVVNTTTGKVTLQSHLKGPSRVAAGRQPIALAVGEGVVMVMLRNGVVLCFHAENLKQMWSAVALSKGSGLLGGTSGLFPDQVSLFVSHVDRTVFCAGNGLVVALDARSGKVKWREDVFLARNDWTSDDYAGFLEANSRLNGGRSDDDDDQEATIPVNDYKLGPKKATDGSGSASASHAVSWQVFRTDVGRSLPHSSHEWPRMQLLHYKRDQPGRVRKRDQHYKAEKPPNVVVVHTKHGITVLQSSSGKLVTQLPLAGPRYGGKSTYVDLDGDGNVDHIEALPGQPEEPLPLPECWGRVTSGVPATSGLWNGTICVDTGSIEMKSTVHVAIPLVVHEEGDDVVRFGATKKPNEGLGLHEPRTAPVLTTATRSVVFMASTGTVTRYDANGVMLWQRKTNAKWEREFLSKTPQLIQLGQESIAAVGDGMIVVLDLQTGKRQSQIVLSDYLICPILIIPIVEEVEVDGGRPGAVQHRKKAVRHDGKSFRIITFSRIGVKSHTLLKDEDFGARYAMFFGLVVVFAIIGLVCGLVFMT